MEQYLRIENNFTSGTNVNFNKNKDRNRFVTDLCELLVRLTSVRGVYGSYSGLTR